MTLRLTIERLPSPLGELIVICRDRRLCASDFADIQDRTKATLQRCFGPISYEEGAAPASVREGFAGYFDGDMGALAALPLSTAGTAFQEQVWRALRQIAPGERRSYGQLAAELGHPTAYRAVGLANGSNPIAIAIPCHRVVGKDGTLTGYAGGLERKAWLLDHEQRHC